MVETILTPTPCETPTVMNEQNSFLIDNYFSELESDSQKGIARENLGVYGKTDLYTLVEVDNNIGKAVNDAVKSLLAADDPHLILPKVYSILADYVRVDGTTPFTAPQVGVTPLLDSHLTTKKFVTELLDNHVKQSDPHNTMDLVNEALKLYSLASNVYSKSEVYTKELINKMTKSLVKNDGTTPFTAPQSGVTPIIDLHLATKRYVDNVMFKHDVSVDPHGFLTILNLRLGNYYKTTETYSKQETYSRAQIDLVINTLVTDASYQAVKEHTRQFDPHNILKEVQNQHYVKRDGSVPFINIQKGVEGIEDNDLATVGLVNRVKEEVTSQFGLLLPIWVTSGPVLTTVGFMEDNMDIPSQMSFQEAMDAIFYGKVVDIYVEDTIAAGSCAEVIMAIRGGSLIEKAELYQNETLIGSYTRDLFLEWEYRQMSEPILVNTVFTFIVTYINGQLQTASCITNVSHGIFVGAIPKYCKPGDLRHNTMMDLVENDPANNAMYSYNENVTTIQHNFNFVGEAKKLVLAIPFHYNLLDYMNTQVQRFGVDAFDIENIPVVIPGLDNPVLFTFYVYKESLIAFDSEVTFKLSRHE